LSSAFRAHQTRILSTIEILKDMEERKIYFPEEDLKLENPNFFSWQCVVLDRESRNHSFIIKDKNAMYHFLNAMQFFIHKSQPIRYPLYEVSYFKILRLKMIISYEALK
jgi:hypothetical protein